MNETLEQKLAALKLGRIRQVYPSWLEQAAHSELGYGEFLEQLLTEELQCSCSLCGRADRRVEISPQIVGVLDPNAQSEERRGKVSLSWDRGSSFHR
jgi:DNA replication protein DnaC